MMSTKNLVLSAMFVALGVIIPQFFHMLGLGSVFLPMHIPVIICAYVCGPLLGCLCGAVTVVLSSTLTGMPPMMPTGLAMIFELAAYGLFVGLFYKKSGKIYLSLILGMILGRIVSIIAKYIIFSLISQEFALVSILSGLFITAWPGIVIQLIVIPAIIYLLKRYKLIA
jgi:uncharacterized membrane protein